MIKAVPVRMQNFWLHRYAILLAVCTLFLVVAGASVTSKQAGLSVPDWPLSYGQVMPPMTGGVFFEHGHRMVGTTVGMLTIGLLVWILSREKRSWMRKLGWVALGMGDRGRAAGRIDGKAADAAAGEHSAHVPGATVFFAHGRDVRVHFAKLDDGPEMVDDHGWPSLRSLAIIVPLVVLTQIALGAGFRHGAISVMPHMVGAMVVTLVILFVGAFVLQQFPTHRALRRRRSRC